MALLSTTYYILYYYWKLQVKEFFGSVPQQLG